MVEVSGSGIRSAGTDHPRPTESSVICEVFQILKSPGPVLSPSREKARAEVPEPAAAPGTQRCPRRPPQGPRPDPHTGRGDICQGACPPRPNCTDMIPPSTSPARGPSSPRMRHVRLETHSGSVNSTGRPPPRKRSCPSDAVQTATSPPGTPPAAFPRAARYQVLVAVAGLSPPGEIRADLRSMVCRIPAAATAQTPGPSSSWPSPPRFRRGPQPGQ